MSENLTYKATDEDEGARLDKVLATAWPDQSRSRIKALIEDGQLSVNGAPATKMSAKVKTGDVFDLIVPEPEMAEPVPEDIKLDVLYEDDDLLVINKPAGMVVHPAAGNESGTLVNALLAHCGDSLSGIGGVKRPGIVHRLDKDTSGAMVVAKNDTAHRALSNLFAEDKDNIDRAYIAVVWGVPKPLNGDIEGNIGRSPRNRKKMAVVKNAGKHALTHYKTLQYRNDSLASLVECRLATGRTHQIRVHMNHIGHSLVCDPVYGRNRTLQKFNLETQEILNAFNKQALHARTLGFLHPRTGKYISTEAPIPEDLLALMEALELYL
ncbi:RluA family pseudouridine synthase [Thalassospira sp.]|uniref:RluA family pseudouridine synthase n=1 Tax=Thalassospira sp. TaxID=1912094 RepID=UPI000C5E6744|nr:RluA family pseudouridine synthase [Thalassospira sp.]MBC06927.1 RNA pseudouridine synthase [Thalassospira sp.]|tara:strand:- start:9823 stop:10794 length:972 start_codon:yes stop_codon:yes gene_type:complete